MSLHFSRPVSAGAVRGSGEGQACLRLVEGKRSLGLAPLQPRGPSGWGSRPPALQLLPAEPVCCSIFRAPLLPSSALNICTVDLLAVGFVCLGCDTISILHFNDSSLYCYCLNHSVYLLPSAPATFPPFSQISWGPAHPSCCPSSATPAAVPPHPKALLSLPSLLGTALKPDVAPPSLPPPSPDLPGLQGAKGEERPSTHILLALSASLPSPAAHAKEGRESHA